MIALFLVQFNYLNSESQNVRVLTSSLSLSPTPHSASISILNGQKSAEWINTNQHENVCVRLEHEK